MQKDLRAPVFPRMRRLSRNQRKKFRTWTVGYTPGNGSISFISEKAKARRNKCNHSAGNVYYNQLFTLEPMKKVSNRLLTFLDLKKQ
jgi:hypothetical protein